MNISNGNNDYNHILGTDDMSRPITRDHLAKADTAIAKLKLLASIEGPIRLHLCDILTHLEGVTALADNYRKRNDDLTTAIINVVKPDIQVLIQSELDSRSHCLITADEVRDEILDSIKSRGSVRNEILEIFHDNIDTGDIKEDVKQDIMYDVERELEDRVNDLIAGYDFGDMLDDHTRDLDEKIVKRLADEISDDHNHPLVNAILNALVIRIGKA